MCSLLMLSLALWIRARSQEKARVQYVPPEAILRRTEGGYYGSVENCYCCKYSANHEIRFVFVQEEVTSASG